MAPCHEVIYLNKTLGLQLLAFYPLKSSDTLCFAEGIVDLRGRASSRVVGGVSLVVEAQPGNCQSTLLQNDGPRIAPLWATAGD